MSTSEDGPIVAVAQPAGTTRRQTEGAPAARLARWALRAVITVTTLGVALAACGNTSDPTGNVARATYPGFRGVAIELDTRIGFLPR